MLDTPTLAKAGVFLTDAASVNHEIFGNFF
jgi:hypothetical protein